MRVYDLQDELDSVSSRSVRDGRWRECELAVVTDDDLERLLGEGCTSGEESSEDGGETHLECENEMEMNYTETG